MRLSLIYLVSRVGKIFKSLIQFCSSFGNAEYRGLFNTLDLQAKAEDTHPELAPLADIMDSWTVQPGFPLVRVTWVSEQLFHISQVRCSLA